MKTKAKITRKDTREHLAQFHLACELVKVIHHYFPGLLSLLKNLEDPRDQRYITYESHVLLMTRILLSLYASVSSIAASFYGQLLLALFYIDKKAAIGNCETSLQS